MPTTIDQYRIYYPKILARVSATRKLRLANWILKEIGYADSKYNQAAALQVFYKLTAKPLERYLKEQNLEQLAQLELWSVIEWGSHAFELQHTESIFCFEALQFRKNDDDEYELKFMVTFQDHIKPIRET